MTIREAVEVINKKGLEIKKSDIYRHALHGSIHLSIYFQSPITLRKIQRSSYKVRLRPCDMSSINRLCLLDKKAFIEGHNFIVSTTGKYIIPTERVIDTLLIGYEYVLVQKLLSQSLKIPLPVTGAIDFNHGITVSLQGEPFQLFDKMTWEERITQKIMQLPKNISPYVHKEIFSKRINNYLGKEYFPAHILPRDAWFVIRHAELDKVIEIITNSRVPPLSATRISTPLSRFFWLACKNNEVIRPLISKPYKLLSIFEQWASDEGITDRLSGDTWLC
ncbi:hypothetical protein [Klebsiella pneumoniae]|uniref:hypothetical protein n=1 Tax=Klebsiella pneumoniae TaxID=573 RepID=UPI00259E38F6|nr:hypothetical protein [Klebsiella pneumoniae]MDM7903569.1 hypothetical protein [Klebsiella pneumoniae]